MDAPYRLPVPSSSTGLIDKFGRQVTYLRLSITDRCDFRCHYCMAEEMSFLPRAEILTLEECLRVASSFVGLGVNKIRVTGGEPLVRQNVLWLLERLAALPGVQELVLTTNGSQLERLAAGLRDAGVKRLNISLDTLHAERFRQITRIGNLAQVLRGIDAALTAGFERLKINTVLLRGINDDELIDLVQFAIDHAIDIAFIEQMPLGEIGHDRQDWFSGEEAMNRLRQRFTLLPSTDTTGGPARYWRMPETTSRIGFISPHTHNFCDTCNRVRVTARGELYPCLGDNGAVPLMPVLRQQSTDDALLRSAIVDALGIKARGHDFNLQIDRPRVVRFMSMTGG